MSKVGNVAVSFGRRRPGAAALRLRQGNWLPQFHGLACFSSKASHIVAGLTEQSLHDDAVREYMRVNFPDHEQDPWTGDVTDKARALLQAEKEKKLEEELKAQEVDEDGIDSGLPAARHLNILPIRSYRRVVTGTKDCYRLRDNLWIPGILYGRCGLSDLQEEKILVQTQRKYLQREVDRFGRGLTGHVYDLTLFEQGNDDEPIQTIRVTPRDVQAHPTQGLNKLFCVNFLRYATGRAVDLPIRYINQEESTAIKRGGFIVPRSRSIPVVMENDDVPIPSYIDLDCTGLKAKDVLRLHHLHFPPGVKPYLKEPRKFLAGTVYGKRSASADDELL